MLLYNVMNDELRPAPRRVAHSRSVLDRLGAVGSLLCAIHCALLPVLIAALPSMGFAVGTCDGF